MNTYNTLTVYSTILLLLLNNVYFISGRPEPELQGPGPAIELPVQLIGFPVIVASVRIANFLRKLGYSLDPKTYYRPKREISYKDNEDVILDINSVEKKLADEFGKDFCIYEKECIRHAIKARKDSKGKPEIDWSEQEWKEIISKYAESPQKTQYFYLLSVFLGEIITSPNFCRALAKRDHRSCQE